MSAGLQFYKRMFGEPASQQDPGRRREIDRATLPTPRQYLARRGLLGIVRGEWATVRCPVHKGGEEQHPSMSVSLVDGHFACHACGAKGRDIVKLHMLATGKRFPDAVHDVGGRFQ